MLIWSIRAELLKLRRSCIWIAALVLPLLSAVFGTLNYLGNIAILQDAWYSLWTQHALFYCTLFAPTLMGIYCAYLCRLEHLHGNWNMVMTQPIAVHTVVLSKLVVVSLLSALTQLFDWCVVYHRRACCRPNLAVARSAAAMAAARLVESDRAVCAAACRGAGHSLVCRAGGCRAAGWLLRYCGGGEGVWGILSVLTAAAFHVLAPPDRADAM